jgi:hypothetical protein
MFAIVSKPAPQPAFVFLPAWAIRTVNKKKPQDMPVAQVID